MCRVRSTRSRTKWWKRARLCGLQIHGDMEMLCNTEHFPGLCAYLYLSAWCLPLCWRAFMWECAFRDTLRWGCHPDETNQSNRPSNNRPTVGTSPRHSQSESFLGMSQTGVWREMPFFLGGFSGKVGGEVISNRKLACSQRDARRSQWQGPGGFHVSALVSWVVLPYSSFGY